MSLFILTLVSVRSYPHLSYSTIFSFILEPFSSPPILSSYLLTPSFPRSLSIASHLFSLSSAVRVFFIHFTSLCFLSSLLLLLLITFFPSLSSSYVCWWLCVAYFLPFYSSCSSLSSSSFSLVSSSPLTCNIRPDDICFFLFLLKNNQDAAITITPTFNFLLGTSSIFLLSPLYLFSTCPEKKKV